MNLFTGNRRIYLDHAATTPVDAAVLSVMNDAYKNGYFNPGGLYAEGVLAARKVSASRKSVALLLGTTSDHVIFTRGGTESNNMAILGIVSKMERPHVIVSAIEHAAVLECVKDLEREGKILLSIAPVDGDGIVDMKELKRLLRPETKLVSIMYVNNEIGTVQPIREITKLVRWYKKQNDLKTYPLVHTDAIQAANYLDINVERLGVDLMSLSGSKIYGPKSSGVLYVRNRSLVGPMFHGGDQEFGLRAGTEDIAQVVGFTKALELSRAVSDSEAIRLAELRDVMLTLLEKNIPGVIVNGSKTDRVPNNVNITVPGVSGERLVIELDAKGISCASKSACKEDDGEASHVLTAIRTPQSLAEPRASSPYKGEHPNTTDGAVRFTFGRMTKKAHVKRAAEELVKIVNKIREFEIMLTSII